MGGYCASLYELGLYWKSFKIEKKKKLYLEQEVSCASLSK